MKITLFLILLTFSFSNIVAQGLATECYSETNHDGIIIQNSFPRGGPYQGPTYKHFNYSQLIFFTRIVNETEKPIQVVMNFSADSIPIPNSPGTFMKLFLPPDTMTWEKQHLINYGITHLRSFDESTQLESTIKPNEDYLFNVMAIFYQTDEDLWKQYRGGNRAELILKGKDLYYKMLPQVDLLHCGRLEIKK